MMSSCRESTALPETRDGAGGDAERRGVADFFVVDDFFCFMTREGTRTRQRRYWGSPVVSGNRITTERVECETVELLIGIRFGWAFAVAGRRFSEEWMR